MNYAFSIIKLKGEFSTIQVEGEYLIVNSGAKLSEVYTVAYENSLTGFEFASGIPGTIGGAIYMNAGAYGGEMMDIVESVQVLDLDNFELRELKNEELEFSYRKSIIQRKNYIVTTIKLKLQKGNKELMEQNEMDGLMFKMTDDPRITKIGKFIRKTSLDELPQFWNVLKGDMSLVGTRPPTVDEFEQYEGYHKRRLSMTPGLTGVWQVSGRSDITDFEEIVSMDVEYIKNWSLKRDIEIILKTVQVVLHSDGAR